MIKKIHYCWFGEKKPDAVKRNVEHWARLNPDFTICEWNENNVDIQLHTFARQAANSKKWAFVADIVRLQILLKEGGIYLDSDVELIKPFKCHHEEKLIMGYMYDCALGTAVMYSPPNHPYLEDILQSYNYIRPNHFFINNTIFTAYFVNKVPNFLLNGKEWSNDLCHLYPKEMFEQPSFIKSRGISIHHCCGSWTKKFNKQFGFSNNSNYISHLLKWASRKVRTFQALRTNEFLPNYKAAKQGVKLPFDISNIYINSSPYQHLYNTSVK